MIARIISARGASRALAPKNHHQLQKVGIISNPPTGNAADGLFETTPTTVDREKPIVGPGSWRSSVSFLRH
jgi:hypothetical protein